MAVHFTDSAHRHNIDAADALHAMLHAEASAELDGKPEETTTVYIGRPHPQADTYIEVIAAHRRPREIWIFHVMELSDLYRHLIEESEER